MCGIAGFFSFKNQPADEALLKRMNRLMTHRGPDAEGYYRHRHFGFAMRRLKVIDLSTGDQPIHNQNKSRWIVFNGEIYNYRELRENLERQGRPFYTHSDTEVILSQYEASGPECVQSLAGMFAFAIYDEKEDSLFIARDRLGVKPLFYHESPEGLAFASEIKPILECPWVKKRIDLQAVTHYLSLNYLPHPWTPFEGIKQLPPGCWMKVTQGRVEIQPFWEVPLETPVEESEETALKKIEELLHRSMERRLIADVPIGAFLSGGVDSSTLVALMKEHKQGVIKTFSVGFDDPAYDETPYAEGIAKYFGTEHYEITCKAEDVEQNLPRIAWVADSLLADQAALPLYLVSRLAKQHVTVSLSGDGGDEVFVGYETFKADQLHALYSRMPAFLRKGVIEPWVRGMQATEGKLSFDYRAKKFIQAGDFSPEKAHYWWRTIFTDEEKRALLRPEILGKIAEIDAFPLYDEYFKKSANLDYPSRCLYADLKVWLAGNNLYKVDTMTMAHGLEARVPFLDHELVEYMSRLPFGLKFKGRVLKYLQKKLMRGRLPEATLTRKKAGWHAPIAGWFRGPLRPYLEKTLSRDHAVLDGILERTQVRKILAEHFEARQNHSFKIWGLLILHHWADQFFGQAARPEPLSEEICR